MFRFIIRIASTAKRARPSQDRNRQDSEIVGCNYRRVIFCHLRQSLSARAAKKTFSSTFARFIAADDTCAAHKLIAYICKSTPELRVGAGARRREPFSVRARAITHRAADEVAYCAQSVVHRFDYKFVSRNYCVIFNSFPSHRGSCRAFTGLCTRNSFISRP